MKSAALVAVLLLTTACGGGEDDSAMDAGPVSGDVAPAPDRCADVVCDANASLCSSNVCDPLTGQCVPTPSNEGTSCDDGVYCNGLDVCLGGECVLGTPPSIDDGVECTADSCDEDAQTIRHQPSDVSCDDGDACNGVEHCDLVSGCVSESPEGCDDGVLCNGAEICDPELGCSSGPVAGLDDGIECTVDTCDEGSQHITHVADDALCSDDDVCTTQFCDSDSDCQVVEVMECDDGVFCNGSEICDPADGCGSGLAPNLDDGVECTLDSCDEGSDQVLHVPDDASCGNGLFCDGVEKCESAGCVAGSAPDSDDGIACTLDSCDETSDVLTHLPVDAACAAGEVCDPMKGCVPDEM